MRPFVRATGIVLAGIVLSLALAVAGDAAPTDSYMANACGTWTVVVTILSVVVGVGVAVNPNLK